MWLKLPCEILELIFTQPDIKKRDLLQLQLTCKPWSPLAQKHLYREIEIMDTHSHNNRDEAKERMRLLTQTLLLLNTSVRRWIRVIQVGRLFNTSTIDNPTLELAMLASLCPNITTLTGCDLPPAFYDAISSLHGSGCLQNLQRISSPFYSFEEEDRASVFSYNKAIVEFKDTLTEISVIDVVGRNDSCVQPQDLQHFPQVEKLQLEAFSRFHLSRMSDYISNCCPKTTAISILLGNLTVEMDVDNDQSVITPATQVKKLSIDSLDFQLLPREFLFLERMFPSLQQFKLRIDDYEDENIVPIQHGLQFFNYLSLIPQVVFKYMWLGVSEGLVLLPHLANSLTVQNLYLGSIDEERPAALSIGLDRQIQFAKDFSLTIEINSNDAETAFRRAFDAFKNKSIGSLCIGPDVGYAASAFQKITEEAMVYIVDEFIGLQDLTYSHIEFPAEAPVSKSQGTKHLQRLHLFYCRITEDYYSRLFCMLEHVDQFKLSTSVEDEREYDANISEIRICLPYTSINTFDVSIADLASYKIKVWAGHTYSEIEVKEKDDSRRKKAIPAFKVVLHCMALKTIRAADKSFELT